MIALLTLNLDGSDANVELYMFTLKLNYRKDTPIGYCPIVIEISFTKLTNKKKHNQNK